MQKVIIPIFFLLSLTLKSQTDTLVLSLKDVIRIAQSESPESEIAKTSLSNSYWRYRSFQAEFKPLISLEATLPNLNRSIEAITLQDGQEAYVSKALARNTANIRLEQYIGPTGGRIFARTGLERTDIFATDDNPKSLSYLSTPISIGFVQPIFQFNTLKWDKKTEPRRYEEARKSFSENMEQIAYEAGRLFFQVLSAQLNLEAAKKNKADADTLYAISKGRFEVGRIAETEVLQMELNAINSDASLSQSTLNLQNSIETLRNYLGIKKAIQFHLIPPDRIPGFKVNEEEALKFAHLNRSEALSYELRLIQAERDSAQAKSNAGLNMDIYASFGLSQTGGTLGDAFKQPLDQELIQLGINVPIADWGKSRSRIEIARSNAAITRLEVQRDKINFEREVIVKIQQFDLIREQVAIASRAYELSLRRLDISQNRYRIGKISASDLNIAINEQNSGRRSYIAALRDFWLAYYDIRQLTLYDFENKQSLVRRTD